MEAGHEDGVQEQRFEVEVSDVSVPHLNSEIAGVLGRRPGGTWRCIQDIYIIKKTLAR